MQLLYPLFYRQFGIRRVQSLLMPRTIELNSLPRNSMVHYLTHDSEHPDIDTSKLFYSQYSKPKLVDYPEELVDNKGMPKRKSIIIRSLVRPFHAKNKTFRYIKDHYKIIKDEQTLLINNYNYLDIAYRYTELPLTPYYQWWNSEKTLWKTLDTIAETTQRNHFVFINVPKNLPSVSLMKIFEGKITPAILKVFDTKEKLFVLEFYKWLGEDTKKDSLLSIINEQHYSKINLVFITESGKASILNLGYLNSWIKGSDNTTEFSTVTQFNNLQIQKIFIKYLLMLQMLEKQELAVDTTKDESSASPIGDTPVNQDPQDLAEDKDIREEHDEYTHEHEPDEEEDNSSYSDEFNNITYVVKGDKSNKPEIDKTKISDQELTKAAAGGTIDLDKQFADIDEDLKALELLNNSNMKQKGVRVDKNGELIEEEILDDDTPLEEIQNSIYKSLSVNDSLVQQINQAADYGLLTAPDYKKFLKDLEEYKNLPDPYTGKDKLVNKAIVTKNDVQIDNNKSAIVASDNVIDKTMLESSLLSFDYDYITKVLEKDVLAMVDSIQKAGIVIKSYEIERDTSALGDYEHHTLELKPIDGASSRIHFRVPKIAEDGSYIANGNKYCLRKQRVD